MVELNLESCYYVIGFIKSKVYIFWEGLIVKKSLTVFSALLMLTSVGAAVPAVQLGTTPTVQAASLNAAKLANGKYSVKYAITKSGTTTPSEAARYLTGKAAVTVKNKKATVTLTVTKAGNPFIQAMTLNGQKATVTKKASGNTYTFSNVNLKASHTLGFSLAVPMNGKTVPMNEAATLKFKTSTLVATTKVKLSTKGVKAKAKKVVGTTTKGAKVTVKHGTTTLGKTTAKKTAYTVKLKKAVKKSWKLKVTATKAGYKTVTKTITVAK